MIIHVNFKVDSEEDPDLARWLERLKKKDRVKSFQIRQALKAYLTGGAVSAPAFPVVPVLSGNPPGPGVVPSLMIETGDIFTEKHGQQQGKSEAEILALLDSQF